MIYKENNYEQEMEENSFLFFEEIQENIDTEELTELEFIEKYSEGDDLLNEVINSFNEIDYDAILEYGIESSLILEAGGKTDGLISGVTKAVSNKGKEISKDFNKKNPIATNVFSRMFNVIKNAFGVVQAFTEKAMVTYNINKLRNNVKMMPNTVRYKTVKCFVDGAVDTILEKIKSGMNTAMKFISSIFIAGRIVDQKECQKHYDLFEKVLHKTDDLLLGEIQADKPQMLQQLDVLQNMFNKYSQIKTLQKSFLMATNAVNNPMKMVNLADKLYKTANNGQGIQGGAGVAIDITNKVMGNKNIMDIPGVRPVINFACKMLGKGLAWYKKLLTSCLSSLKAAYEEQYNDKKNGYANQKYAKEQQKRGL